MIWERGNLLKEYNNARYEYNRLGLRFRKKVNGKITEYIHEGGKLISENNPSYELEYLYDDEGMIGFRKSESNDYHGHEINYYYVKDVMGNVIGLSNGLATEADYEYDAWGNCTVYDKYGEINTDASFIGNINPIRWKSMYFDVETGLFFLQTRFTTRRLDALFHKIM